MGAVPTRDDVVALQTRVADLSTQIAVVVEGCKAKLDAPTLAQWDDLAKRLLVWASADPASANYTTGTALLAEANAFASKLTTLGCSNAPPPVPVPATPPPAPSSSPFGDIAETVKWAAIGLALIALLGRGGGGRSLF